MTYWTAFLAVDVVLLTAQVIAQHRRLRDLRAELRDEQASYRDHCATMRHLFAQPGLCASGCIRQLQADHEALVAESERGLPDASREVKGWTT